MPQLLASSLVTTAYNLALILTGGSDSAESIVTAAIEAVPANELSETTLLTEVARTAWEKSEGVAPVLDEIDESDAFTVSCDLRDVFELPRGLRYCFSLRFLVGLTPYVCGKLIGLRSEQVDYLVMRSMLLLAKAAECKEQRMLTAAR